MSEQPRELPFLSNIGLMLTYKCTIACPHCLIDGGPHRSEEMDMGKCLTWIDEAVAYRNGHVLGLALTGGEPFHDMDRLTRVSSYAMERGRLVSAVTNAFWATDRQTALQTLARVPAIRLFAVSTDSYHQRFIPFDYVKNAVWAIEELGRSCTVAVCTDNEDNVEYQAILRNLAAIGHADDLRLAITFPVGRAKRIAHRSTYYRSRQPADTVCTEANSPVIFPNGDVIACIGPVLTLPAAHPLYLGNLFEESLATVLDRAELNPILHTIRTWGPHKLLSLLREHGLDELLPKEYLCDCACDVCYKLFSDPRAVEALDKILQDMERRQYIAYGRVFHLNETTMARHYGLGTPVQAERCQQAAMAIPA